MLRSQAPMRHDETDPAGLATHLAVIFPGQGSQDPGIGAAWVDHPAWTVVERAEEVTGRHLRHLLVDRDADLGRTEDAQIAVFLASLLAWEAARPVVQRPIAFAGHSLGQITALVAAGAVGLDDGIILATRRARITQDCADRTPGALLALLGATAEQADEAVAAVPEAWVANDNAPGQLVVGGTPEALEEVGDAARTLGVRRTRPLAVRGAFHTPLMAGAAEALAPVLDQTRFADIAAPIVTNHDASPHRRRDAWSERLTSHLVRPVRWRASVDTIAELGCRRFVELGPGTTLSSLVRRCRDDVVPLAASSPTAVEELTSALPPTA